MTESEAIKRAWEAWIVADMFSGYEEYREAYYEAIDDFECAYQEEWDNWDQEQDIYDLSHLPRRWMADYAEQRNEELQQGPRPRRGGISQDLVMKR